jgi:hypothetical protein
MTDSDESSPSGAWASKASWEDQVKISKTSVVSSPDVGARARQPLPLLRQTRLALHVKIKPCPVSRGGPLLFSEVLHRTRRLRCLNGRPLNC